MNTLLQAARLLNPRLLVGILATTLIILVSVSYVLAPQGPPPIPAVTKVLSEISLVHNLPRIYTDAQSPGTTLELSRFLWEPGQYAPSASEIYLEVVGSFFIFTDPFGQEPCTGVTGMVTVQLVLTGTTTVVAGSGLTLATSFSRLRTGDLLSSFPTSNTEMSLTAAISGACAGLTVQRAALLVQQSA